MRSESFTELNPAVTVFVLSQTSHDHLDWLEEKNLRHMERYTGIQKSESTQKIWDSESNLNLKIGFRILSLIYHFDIVKCLISVIKAQLDAMFLTLVPRHVLGRGVNIWDSALKPGVV